MKTHCQGDAHVGPLAEIAGALSRVQWCQCCGALRDLDGRWASPLSAVRLPKGSSSEARVHVSVGFEPEAPEDMGGCGEDAVGTVPVTLLFNGAGAAASLIHALVDALAAGDEMPQVELGRVDVAVHGWQLPAWIKEDT